MKRKDIVYAIGLALLVLGITGALYYLLSTRNTVYGSQLDWLGQHVAFAEYIRDNFYETHQLIPDFSMHLGAGQNMIEFSYYGILRPEILVSFLFPMVKMSTYLMVSSIFLTILSVELFYYWVRKQGISEFHSAFAAVIFLTAGPIIFHTHRHVMFVNYFPWMILTLIGIQRYLQKRKSDVMITGVVLMILASYFFSVSALFMCGIYALYEVRRRQEDISMKEYVIELIRIAGHVLIGVGISCIILFPTALMMLSSHREAIDSPTLKQLFMPDWDISGLSYTEYPSNAYSAGMCVIAWVAVLFFLFKNKISSRTLGICILLITMIPVFCYVLNGLQYIREKSLIPMIPLVAYMVAVMLSEFKETSKKFFWLIPFIILPMFFIKNPQLKTFYQIDSILCIGILLLYRFTTLKQAIALYLIFPILLLAPANKGEKFLKRDNLERFEDPMKKSMVKSVLDKDDAMYRFDDRDFALRTTNQVLDQRQYKTSLFSSNKNNDYANFYSDIMAMPSSSSNNANHTVGKNAFFQSMMSVKYMYIVGSTPINYEIVAENGKSHVIKNDQVLPMGYVSHDMMSTDQFEKLSYPYSMEAIYRNTVVEKAQDEKRSPSKIHEVHLAWQVKRKDPNISVKKTKNGYKFNVKKTAKMTLKLDEPIQGDMLILELPIRNVKKKSNIVSIQINGVINQRGADTDIYSNKKTTLRYVLDQNKEWKELNMIVSKGEYEIQNPKAYLADGSILSDRVNSVDPLIAKRHEDSILSGDIKVTADGYFVTSLPYQKGFQVRVDGNEVPYEKVNTAFVGFPMKKGEHTVQITYEMPGKKVGIMMSVISLLVVVMLYGKTLWIRKKRSV